MSWGACITATPPFAPTITTGWTGRCMARRSPLERWDQVNGLPGDQGLLGDYRAGVWYDDSQYLDFTTIARGQPPSMTQGNWGVYGLADQVLVRFGKPGSNRGFGVTGSILVSPDQSVSQ